MITLGLDASLRQFGWSVYCGSFSEPLIDRGRFCTESSSLFVDRYILLRDNLSRLIKIVQPSFVGVEYPVFNALYSEGLYGLFLFSCEALRKNKCNTVFFSPGQVKAQARFHLGRPGKWKMQKADMVEAALKHSGDPRKWNHNEADAYWVANLTHRFSEFYHSRITELDLNPVEKHLFLNIKIFKKGVNKGKKKITGVFYREDERFFLWGNE